MKFEISVANNALLQKQAVNEIIRYNEITSRFGLMLTQKQALELVETRTIALKDTGRIEFGGGVIDKIIFEFCDSSYISMNNYEQTLHELIDIFYYYKNDTIDLISDDDLIKYMKKSFDGECHGSLELLSGRELYNLANNLRSGGTVCDVEDEKEEGEEAEDEEY